MKKITQLLGLGIIALLSCNGSNKKKMENKDNFSWGVGVTAPREYPVEIHRGYLGNENKMIAEFINIGLIQYGWVYDGEALSGGNEIPTHLSLTWISYGEKKFWKIETAIDKTTQDKIQKLFEEGYIRKERNGELSHITYKKITVGLAPGGTVVLWLSGLNKKVEIAHYQAVETFVSVNEFYRNPDEDTQQEFYNYFYNAYIPKETKEYIKKNGVPVKLWKEFRTKYNYRFNIHFYKTDKESSERETEYVNGEKEIVKVEDLIIYQNKPLPSYCRFWFSQYNAEAEFDGEEILNAFKKLTIAHPDKKIEIEAKVAFMYKTTTFTVRCEGDEIPLEKTVVRMWKN
ncbi:DUF2931 family protein [Flavobacterium sp. 2]|uniref:DUF2931 family protein n=1 Tax=Flavobacterium sp. 2 TaxID=308053 RepID=UPI000C184A3F|nr:DUF2931 family protein [Flavobacterium sp. 2]PIF70600.1 Protein of unknown function (DUF2931) [Flavobacterium sp. 2]